MTSRGSTFDRASPVFFGALLLGVLVVALLSLAGHGSASAKIIWMSSSVGYAALTALSISLLRAPKAAWLIALLILSGACQLWVSQGNWFKTLRMGDLGGLNALAYACILFQGSLSLIVLLADKEKWLSRSIRRLSSAHVIRLGFLFACLALFSISIMSFVGAYDKAGYVIQLLMASAMVAATMLGVLAVLFASDLSQVSVPKTFAERLDRHAFILIPSLFFVITVLFSAFAFGLLPVVEDETAYLFQAKTIAGGDFRAPALPGEVADQMSFYLIDSDETGWYATTVPGWPIILSLGVLIGFPWLVNPLLGTVAVVLGMAFWRRVTDRQQAILVGILMLASPWLLEISASWMTHALVLALSLGSWCLIAKALQRTRYHWLPVSGLLFAAGLLMGWIFFTRAMEGVIIGGLTGVCLLWLFGRHRQLIPIAAYGLGCLTTGSLYFFYNYHMTGDILQTPLMAYLIELWGHGANAIGFGPDIGPPGGWGNLDLWPGHSPSEALINLNNSLSSLNTELFGWSFGSLILILVWGLWGRRKRIEIAMAVLVGAVIFVHFFYWFTGTFYIGPRYWFGAFFAFIVLSLAGLNAIRNIFLAREGEQFGTRLNIFLIIICGFSIAVFSTWRGVERYVPRTQLARSVANYDLPQNASPDAIVALPCQRLLEKAMHLNDPYLRGHAPMYILGASEADMENVRGAFPARSIVYASELNSHCR